LPTSFRTLFIVIATPLSFFLTISFSTKIHSSIHNYLFPSTDPSYSNYGGLGIIQNPNARFLEEGSLSFTWSHNEPYLRGSVVAYPFDWLEASFQYTDINNALYSPYSEFSGSQSLKDKSFDAKIRILKERRSFPQIAVGIRDVGGTALFASEYIVASKYINNRLDLTLGIGWGNLNNNNIGNPLAILGNSFEDRNYNQGLGGKVSFGSLFSGNAGIFGGLEYFFKSPRGLRLKVEYDGTNYITEGPEEIAQDSKINFGLYYPISNNFSVKLSHARGNTLNFGFSYSLSLGRKNPLKRKKESFSRIDDSNEIKTVTAISDDNLFLASLSYLSKEGINLQTATIQDNKLEVAISQSRFRSSPLAVGRTMRIVDAVSPDKIKNISVSTINGGIGMYTATLDRDTFNRYQRFNSPNNLQKNIDLKPFQFNQNDYIFVPKSNFPIGFHSLGPDLRSQIGGPDGFFFGDLKLTLDSEILFSRNLSLLSSISFGLYDNMDELKLPSDSILPHVRTEIVQYLKQSRDLAITRLQLNHYSKLTPSTYLRFAGGILESMFSGYGFEFLYRPFDGNHGVGIDIWEVFQRDYDQKFSVLDYKTVTGHLTFYYNEPRSNILLKIKGGKYLAKDSGITVDASRIFQSGVRFGIFASLTDISFEEFGEGSFDKGFYFWIPLEIFSDRYFRRTFGWGLRPLTRDGAQSLIYGHPLWGVTDTASKRRFNRDILDFYD